MTHHFVTLLGETYVSRLIALVRSLERQELDYELWVLCVDDRVDTLLSGFSSDRVHLMPRPTWEDNRLATIRNTRSLQEYCWTLTPFSFSKVFERHPQIDGLTYLDADLWFAKSPSDVLDEIRESKCSAYITEHAFSDEHTDLEKYGKFCVQFLYIDRFRGQEVLTDWQDKCANWCFARLESGRFGDQKYLDDWPSHFGSAIRIGQPSMLFQGPWNAAAFDPESAMTYHFSSLRFIGRRRIQLADSGYQIPNKHLEKIYGPYLLDLEFGENWVRSARRRAGLGNPQPQKQLSATKRARSYLGRFLRACSKTQTSRYIVTRKFS